MRHNSAPPSKEYYRFDDDRTKLSTKKHITPHRLPSKLAVDETCPNETTRTYRTHPPRRPQKKWNHVILHIYAKYAKTWCNTRLVVYMKNGNVNLCSMWCRWMAAKIKKICAREQNIVFTILQWHLFHKINIYIFTILSYSTVFRGTARCTIRNIRYSCQKMLSSLKINVRKCIYSASKV